MISFTAIEHHSDSRYCFAISLNEALLRLRLDKHDEIDKVEVLYGHPWDFGKKQNRLTCHLAHKDRHYVYYQAIVKDQECDVIYLFLVHDKEGRHFFYSEEGCTETFDFSFAFLSAFEMCLGNKEDLVKIPSKWEGRLFYQIFPERFAHHYPLEGKKHVNQPWNAPLRRGGEVFVGGDILGIVDKLDYLKSLGVGAIYLNPIHLSKTNHKYDVMDYFSIDPTLGSMEEFELLIKQCHDRDILLMMDMVFNHMSYLNPIAQDALAKGKESQYWDWFFPFEEKMDFSKGNYLKFHEVRRMVKINTSNKETSDYLIKVGKFWQSKGVDGFRLDVAQGVSHSFWRRFKMALRESDPSFLLIGEDWLDSSSFLSATELDGVMNYPFLSALSKYFLNGESAEGLALDLDRLLIRYPGGHNKMMLNLVSSHDIPRFFSLLGKDVNKLMAAYAIMISYIGLPCLYYGEEIFLEGNGDPDNRRPFKWEEAENRDPVKDKFASLLNYHSKPLFSSGEIDMKEEREMFCLVRYDDKSKITLYVNLTSSPISIGKEAALSNGYEDGTLYPTGFAFFEE